MAETILTLFRRNALRLGDKPCLHYKNKGKWERLSWVDAEEKVRRLALGLAALGLKPGEKAAILSQTRMEWTLLDLSILANHAVVVPLYPTLAPDQIAYILKDSEVSLLIVENKLLWGKVEAALKGWHFPKILIEGIEEGFLSLEALVEKGKKIPVNQYDETLKLLKASDTATLVYTSGTTGFPKGAMITHRNILAEVEGLRSVFSFGENQIGLMCLPLAHVIARAMQFHQLAQGCQAAYCESLEALPQNLREIRPHYMAAVPRLFEKSHEKILHRAHTAPKFLQKLFAWSLNQGETFSELRQKRMRISLWIRAKYVLASLLIFRKIRKGFGGRMQFLISGGAPLSKAIAQFFHATGMLILEGYGLTETFAAITLNRPDDFRFGTVGKPLEGVRLKINAEGEICAKGDLIFAGYWGKKEATETVFDGEGWFLTGDIGEFTKDGFLRITDRKKDIIVTSGGKNIAPQNIENLLQQSRYIQQAYVYGDGRKFLSALVTLHWEAIQDFARKNQIVYYSESDLASHDRIQALVSQEIEAANQRLSSFETIKKFAILDAPFSIESGELTPTMKVKRKVVYDKYKNILDRFYSNNEERGIS